jgi:hypothetical protein
MNNLKVFNSFIPKNNQGPVVNVATNAANRVANTVNKALNSPANAAANVANSALNSLRNTAANMSKTVGNVANNFRNTMTSTIENTTGNLTTSTNGASTIPWLFVGIGIMFIVIVVLLVVFYRDIKNWLPDSLNDLFNGPKKEEDRPEPTPNTVPMPNNMTPVSPPANIVNQLLPGKKEVFNVSSNKYIYSDAEPLCKALGAELATYDQVKAAFDQGADWCNYGWTKGQLALYPTQEGTWEKLQLGPEGQRQACGRPGVNGGYFDNPELRFGVNCYGTKPKQSAHDSAINKGAPISPDALDFDKKVSMYRSDADDIGILPFREGAWSE